MAYKDKFGITKIREGQTNNLDISWDYENDPNDLKQRKAVFLFTPDMKNAMEHYHIELDQQQANVLRKWLNQFLNEVD